MTTKTHTSIDAPFPEVFAAMRAKLESENFVLVEGIAPVFAENSEAVAPVPPAQNPDFLYRIEGPKLTFVNTDLRRVVSFCYVGNNAEGPPGMVHGGALFTMVDNALSVCACRSLVAICVTATVSINYLAPMYLGSWLRVEAEINRVEKKKAFLSFAAFRPDETKVVGGTSLFIVKARMHASL